MTLVLLLAALYAGINLYTFLLFGWDKHCARHNKQRVPEVRLLGVALCGGALGALLGQQVFRHKTLKQPFRFWLQAAAVLNLVVLGFLAATQISALITAISPGS
jgi:uncharacterized membrane protein YsdA (DUF1294 family)